MGAYPRLSSLSTDTEHGAPFGVLSQSFFKSGSVSINWRGALAVASLLLVIVYWVGHSFFPWTSPPATTCDAFAAPGSLFINITSPIHTYWKPIDELSCRALPNYLPALWELSHSPDHPPPSYTAHDYSEDYADAYSAFSTGSIPRRLVVEQNDTELSLSPVGFLRRPRSVSPPTILIIGDSVDRNGLVHFCQLMGRNVTISHYTDVSQHPLDLPKTDPRLSHGPPLDGWDQRGLPHLCEIPFRSGEGRRKEGGVAMRVVNGFHYGMDALDEFNTPAHGDWHAPGRIERRIDELFVPMMEQMGGVNAVDLIVLHSGMWDLALFGMQDDKNNWSLRVPLTPEQLAWWQERMRRTIHHVRLSFPRARIVYRKMHRTDDVLPGTQYITNCERVQQLRHLQEEVARSEGLPTFDFGHLIEGYQYFQEKVHPLMVPGGVMYAQALVHELRLAMDGRRQWRVKDLLLK